VGLPDAGDAAAAAILLVREGSHVVLLAHCVAQPLRAATSERRNVRPDEEMQPATEQGKGRALCRVRLHSCTRRDWLRRLRKVCACAEHILSSARRMILVARFSGAAPERKRTCVRR
jgi:hypothetical protein